MRILVTGGAGFIGSHLVSRLIKRGHQVVVFDNESTGRQENVAPAVEYIKGDVAHLAELEQAFMEGLDAVCHIAGQVSMIRSFSHPILDLRTNVEGTVNVLQLCLRHRVNRLLYASSMTVYGATDVLPTPEVTPCNPISYYGVSKYAAERYVVNTAARVDLDFDFRVTCFRMYSVYGPRQALNNPYQGVMGIFLGNLLRGEQLTIFGDGEQSRDFVYIDDVVDAWVNAISNQDSYGKVINLGSGARLTVNQLADHVLSAFGRTRAGGTIVYAPARPGEQQHVQADVTRAQQLLGWHPQVPFEVGMRYTASWALQVFQNGVFV